ncbi:cytochrome c oxidase assembly protein CtaG/Cox11-domain-containing protein [Boletus coccyginus]|nr:cytochrome c oxidase assembly protein CtaG/Cox11-domain-containing protein [Boletus coccyginus]
MLTRFIPLQRASHWSALYPVHSCVARPCSFSSRGLQSWLSRSPIAPWRPIKQLFNARMSTRPSPPRPPYSPFARRHQARQQLHAARNRNLLLYSTAVIVLGVGVTYAAVPLYRMFCAATGFAGTPVVSTSSGRFDPSRLVPVEGARRIRVHFNADRSETLPWKFFPQQKYVDVLLGESSLAFYKARNESKKDVIGIATYNVTPDRVAPYFSKVECFCFEEQKLLAGEEVDMPLLFFIDKDMLDDPSCRNIDDIVLSYTFFRARRNVQGHLEPDAADDVVQKSLGFDGYEHAPRAEVRR